MGICHGAAYMAMFDFAHSSIICHTMGKYCGTPTISINIDYIAPSSLNEWIYTEVTCLKLSNTMGFSQGVIRS
jgi:acyl-coenzyme A thioesterase PaaI-like protein